MEQGTAVEASGLVVGSASHDEVFWHASIRLEKYAGDDTTAPPVEVVERVGNLLLYGGMSNLWECLIGNGTGTGGQTLTYFNNANAYIGVGDSVTAAVATQTDLQAASNKLRKAMEATYPQHADGTGSGAATITFKSSFGVSDANWAWNEWGIFNGSSGGRMLNRKVESLGTKTAGTWVLTVTVTLA